MGLASRAVIDESLLEEGAAELYEYGPCGFLTMLPNGLVARANHTFLQWTGYAPSEVTDRPFQDLLDMPGKIFYDTHLAPLLTMQGAVRELAFNLVSADGTHLPVLLNSTLKRNESGEPLLIETAIFNATDRRRYEQELLLARREAERALKVKADLLSMISHDVRTPASAIVSAVQILERLESLPQQDKALRILQSASTNLIRLLNEVLEYSKVAAGNLRLDEHEVDTHNWWNNLVATFAHTASEKGVRVAAHLDPGVPHRIVIDDLKIGQVLSNLLGNAIKFTEAAGEVRLSCELVDQEPGSASLAFSVSDTGIGIAAERLPHIFDEFTQADSGIARKYGGTGLGLSICQKLLALYDSQLEVRSREGEGSTFSFRLQLRLPAD